MQIARCLQTLCFGCLILLLYYPLEIHSQSKPKDVAGTIQCSIKTETATWFPGRGFSVTVRIKNIADGPVDIVGHYSFTLTRVEGPALAYWSPVNISDGTPVELKAGKVPENALHLELHETKAIELDVTKLFWDRNVSSVWPNRTLFEVVPKGNYDLIFDVETDKGENSNNMSVVTHTVSNKVGIIVR